MQGINEFRENWWLLMVSYIGMGAVFSINT